MTVERYLMEAKKGEAVYVEDVFSTYLYTGTGASQTITNNIDLSTKGGLVWCKARANAYDNWLVDTNRGINTALFSNNTQANYTSVDSVTSFNPSGFTLSGANGGINGSATNVSWTFRKQPKFFDVVTYTGNGSARTIAHNLGSVPGMIIVKRTDTTSNWQVYHIGLTSAANSIQLNLTAAQASAPTVWNSTAPTSTVFSVGTDVSVNANGGTYVAYLFANQAGGFGLSGSDSVVACGRFDAIAPTPYGNVTLGWEPQFLLLKQINSPGSDWYIIDTMRGFSQTQGSDLKPNTTAVEGSYWAGAIVPTATGFNIPVNLGSVNYIYLAIRRGPMKVPTSGTSVFAPVLVAPSSTGSVIVPSGFVDDFVMRKYRSNSVSTYAFDRLRGATYLETASTVVESAVNDYAYGFDLQNGFRDFIGGGDTYVYWHFRRAPGYMDVVCYNGGLTSINHNLGVKPELIFIKVRTVDGRNWIAAYGTNIGGYLNTTSAINTGNAFIDLSSATSTTFPSNGNPEVGQAGQTYVAYLFATCPGVSKVGSYTGTGAAQNIDCGFSSGARFVIIKRIDNSGSWYVYDSARGISSGNDPYLVLNTTAVEVTGTNYVDAYASGFSLTASAPAEFNANGGSYLFLAIA